MYVGEKVTQNARREGKYESDIKRNGGQNEKFKKRKIRVPRNELLEEKTEIMHRRQYLRR